MKIAFLGHKRIPSREGGAEIVVEELARRMAAKGHDVTVYNRRGRHVADKARGNAHVSREYDYNGIHIITVPTFEKKSLNAITAAFFATLHAVFQRYDVIHYHAEGSCAMLPLAKLFRKNTVATIHGLDWQRAKWGGFATRFLKFAEKTAAKYADEIIVLSRGVQQYFWETYGRGTNYIPNGVSEPERKSPKIISEKYGLEEGGYILFLARIVPEKGAHYLIEAFRGIQTEKKLVIAGGGSHSDNYVNRIQTMAAKDKRIIMPGFVEGRELEELYSNCFCYVLPSDIEGMPLSLLEAMSYGCRCLVSDIAENVEVTEEKAIHFQKGSVADLQGKLAAMLTGSASLPSPEEIRSFVLERYNWDDVTERTLKIYESVNRQ